MSMRARDLIFIAIAMAALVLMSPGRPAEGQTGTSARAAVTDLNGLWEGGVRDLGEYVRRQGGDIPFTEYGAERYISVDLAENPNGYCLPPGPSRAITGPSPFLIVQSDDVVALLHENHGVYRPIYLDGRHPEDILDYPQFMGHSVGWWEAGVLVVDTVGINDRTWLDSYGLEHSIQLRLTERFEKTGPDLIRYTVTFEDPIFYAEPWSVSLELRRMRDGRLMEYVCRENERDLQMLRPTDARDE